LSASAEAECAEAAIGPRAAVPCLAQDGLTAGNGKTVRASLDAFDVIDPRVDFPYSIPVRTRSVTTNVR
jgi:hypothetical protein